MNPIGSKKDKSEGAGSESANSLQKSLQPTIRPMTTPPALKTLLSTKATPDNCAWSAATISNLFKDAEARKHLMALTSLSSLASTLIAVLNAEACLPVQVELISCIRSLLTNEGIDDVNDNSAEAFMEQLVNRGVVLALISFIPQAIPSETNSSENDEEGDYRKRTLTLLEQTMSTLWALSENSFDAMGHMKEHSAGLVPVLTAILEPRNDIPLSTRCLTGLVKEGNEDFSRTLATGSPIIEHVAAIANSTIDFSLDKLLLRVLVASILFNVHSEANIPYNDAFKALTADYLDLLQIVLEIMINLCTESDEDSPAKGSEQLDETVLDDGNQVFIDDGIMEIDTSENCQKAAYPEYL
ncbi:hypothetical protein HDU83_009031 [Entophlyctis luteolus]|nr:hypothetical protein HDU83_009031 [Entophlyctis luteolus]